MQFIQRNKLIILILLVAAAVRIYNLGYSSFWYDETRIATAAIQPTLDQVVKVARLDVASPPLDYILVWLIGRFSLAEGWLRLPEALWGIAAVAVLFGFARQAFGRFVGLAAALWLALAQIHIYFSQELRFYAPLFFFYWLLTWLLYRAQAEPTRRNWILVIEVAVVGAYFHFYSLLAFLNGLVFLALYSRCRSAWLGFFISGVSTALLVLPGFLIFGLSRSMPELPMVWGDLFPHLSIALGWSSMTGNTIGNIMGAAFFILACFGLIAAIVRRSWTLVGLTSTVAIQVGLIITMNALARYFFVTRSFLFALPITFFLAGYALDTLVRGRAESASPLRRFSLNRAAGGLVLVGLVGLSLVTFVQNQPIEKSNARPIATYLHQEWRPGDLVWVNPAWEPYMYLFYLDVYFNDERLTGSMNGYSWEDLPVPDENGGRVFLITNSPGPELRKDLEIRGFFPNRDLEGVNWLWIHTN